MVEVVGLVSSPSRWTPTLDSVDNVDIIYKDNHFIELNTWPHTGCFITVLTANLQWDNKILGLMKLSLNKDT